jgi:5-methylcytosine-specific restriction endonuclease McrA
MNERDKELIKRFKTQKYNLRQLGDIFNISRERARQILLKSNLKATKYKAWNLGRGPLSYNQRISEYGLPKKIRMEILQRDNWTCQYCGANGHGVKLTIDHRVPTWRYNDHTPKNLIVACRSCNSSKGRMSEQEFRDKLKLKKGSG